MKKPILIICAMLCINASNAMPVEIISNIDPKYLNNMALSISSLKQQIQQYADQANDIKGHFDKMKNSRNVVEGFAEFSNTYEGVLDFMGNNVCNQCTAQQKADWKKVKNQINDIQADVRKKLSMAIGEGQKFQGTIKDITEQIRNALPNEIKALAPAQAAAAQAKLLSILGVASEQTNTLLNKAIEIQSAIYGKEALQEQNAQMVQNTSLQKMTEQVKP